MPPEPTLEDVARMAGVSRATASRAIRGADRVSPEAVRAVQEAAASLKYVPNQAARSLVTRRTDTIALVVPEPDERIFSDPFFGAAIAGIADSLEPTNFQLVLAIGARAAQSNRLRNYLASSQADGIVLLSHHTNDSLAEILRELRVPIAFVGRPWPSVGNAPFVDLDNCEGGRIAAKHLIDAGARRLATIAGPQDMPAAQDRLAGWTEVVERAGLDASVVYEGDFTAATAFSLAERLVSEHPDVDGLFAASDPMAIGAAQALRQRGIGIPKDIQLLGFDATKDGAVLTPSLTSITNPARAMSRAAANMLLHEIAGESGMGYRIFQPELVQGGSTLVRHP